MPRYTFTSPLAMGGAALQEALLQRKLEERQRMLDELAAKEAESVMRARAQQITESEARMASQEQQDELAMLDAIIEGVRAKELRDGRVDITGHPQLDLFQKYGYATQEGESLRPQVSVTEQSSVPGVETTEDLLPTPNVRSEDLHTLPEITEDELERWFFSGTPAGIQREQTLQSRGDLISSLGAGGTSDNERLFSQIVAELSPDEEIPAGLWGLLSPERPVYTVSPGGTIRDTGVTSPTGEFISLPRAASPTAAQLPQWVGMSDPDTSGVPRPVMQTPDGTLFTNVDGVPQRYSGNLHAKPSGEEGALGIPVGLLEAHQAAQARLKAGPLGEYGDVPIDETQEIAMLEEDSAMAMANVIESAKVSPSVKSAVAQTLEGQLERLGLLRPGETSYNYDVDEIAAMWTIAGIITEKDVEDFSRLLGLARGQYAGAPVAIKEERLLPKAAGYYEWLEKAGLDK